MNMEGIESLESDDVKRTLISLEKRNVSRLSIAYLNNIINEELGINVVCQHVWFSGREELVLVYTLE